MGRQVRAWVGGGRMCKGPEAENCQDYTVTAKRPLCLVQGEYEKERCMIHC